MDDVLAIMYAASGTGFIKKTRFKSFNIISMIKGKVEWGLLHCQLVLNVG